MFAFNSGSIDNSFQFTPLTTMRSQSYVIRSTGDYDLLINGPDAPGGDEYGLNNIYSCDFTESQQQYVDIGIDNTNNLKETIGGGSGSLTVSCWFNMSEDSGANQLSDIVNIQGDSNLGKFDPLYNASFVLKLINSGGLMLQFGHQYDAGVWEIKNLSVNISESYWHHIAVTRDISTRTYNLYIDSVYKTSHIYDADEVPNHGESASLQMARGINGSQTPPNMWYYYSGQIDEVSIFNVTKSQAEINTIYNSGTPNNVSLMSGCEGWWRMGDSDGPSVYPTLEDYSKNNNNGTMYSMASNDIIEKVPAQTGSI